MAILNNFPPTNFLIMSKKLQDLNDSPRNRNFANKVLVSKSTTSLAIIPPFLLNISIQEPHLLKKGITSSSEKEDMPLSIFGNHVFFLTKYANIQKIIPSIFISSAHQLTIALIIITLLMITILRLILLKIQKISTKKKTPTCIELVQKPLVSSVTKPLLTDLTFNFWPFL